MPLRDRIEWTELLVPASAFCKGFPGWNNTEQGDRGPINKLALGPIVSGLVAHFSMRELVSLPFFLALLWMQRNPAGHETGKGWIAFALARYEFWWLVLGRPIPEDTTRVQDFGVLDHLFMRLLE